MKINITNLRIAMARASMNNNDLIEATGLSKNTIASYTSGHRNPTSKSIGILSKALKCDVTELIEDE